MSDETSSSAAAKTVPYAVSLGKRLRLLRVNLWLSQHAFAARLSTCQDSISRMERGVLVGPPLEMIEALIALCEEERVPLEWFFRGQGVMQLPLKEPTP